MTLFHLKYQFVSTLKLKSLESHVESHPWVGGGGCSPGGKYGVDLESYSEGQTSL